MTFKLPIKKWRSDAILPKFAQKGDAGADCYINGFKKIGDPQKKELLELDAIEYLLEPLERIGCPLGFATAIPEGYYAAVVPRSGLALWEGISLVNTPGTIDSGYRNEWMAIVVNLSNNPVKLKRGDRICQFILRKMEDFNFEVVEDLSDSDRGLGGFGSTGKK
jgi:dUTP pyrophosphatase